MSTVFAILLSAVVVLTQSALPGNAEIANATSRCGRCDCGKKSCCVDRSAPDASSQPAAPATTVSFKRAAWALPVVTAIFGAPTLAFRPASTPFTGTPRPDAVPLYQQNCSFLI